MSGGTFCTGDNPPSHNGHAHSVQSWCSQLWAWQFAGNRPGEGAGGGIPPASSPGLPLYAVFLLFYIYRDMGQCPAKSGLTGYNFITIKIARCTKQHIFATVLRYPFKFLTLVPTPFLCVKVDFYDLHLFRAVDTTIVNPAG